MVKGFSKIYNFLFFGQIFFCKHFYYVTGFCDKKFNFCKFAILFADFKSRAQELSNDVVAEDDPSLSQIERRGKRNTDLPRHHE